MSVVGSVENAGGLRGAVREIVERYAQAVDARELDAAADLFVDDAVLAVPVDAGGAELVERVGRPAIRTALDTVMGNRATHHGVLGVTLTEESADAAAGVVSAVARHLRDVDPPVVDTWVIRYHDRYVVRDGHVRIARRELHRLWVERTVPTGLRTEWAGAVPLSGSAGPSGRTRS